MKLLTNRCSYERNIVVYMFIVSVVVRKGLKVLGIIYNSIPFESSLDQGFKKLSLNDVAYLSNDV